MEQKGKSTSEDKGLMLTAEHKAVLEDISIWCQEESEKLFKNSQNNYRSIWILVIVGIITVTFLPFVLESIDQHLLNRQLPAESLKAASLSVDDMTKIVKSIENRRENFEDDLTSLAVTISDRLKESEAMKQNFSQQPAAIWFRPVYQEVNQSIEARLQYIYWSSASIYSPYLNSFIASALIGDPGGAVPVGIVRSKNGKDWSISKLKLDGEDIFGDVYSFKILQSKKVIGVGRYSENSGNSDKPFIALIGDDVEVKPISINNGAGNFNIIDITERSNSNYYAIGRSEGVFYLLQSFDLQNWTTLKDITISDGSQISDLTSIYSSDDGRIFVSGATKHPIILNISQNNSIELVNLSIGNASGRINKISHVGSKLYAVGVYRGEGIVLESGDGFDWRSLSIDHPYEIMDFSSIREEPIFLNIRGDILFGVGSENFSIKSVRDIPFSAVGNGKMLAISASPDGAIVLGGNFEDGLLGAPVANEFGAVRDLASNEREPDFVSYGVDVLVPESTKNTVERYFAVDKDLKRLNEQQTRLSATIQSTDETLKDQFRSIDRVNDIISELESAFRKAEPYTQISWSITRAIIVVFFIFLIRIVLNRYRYLQRLSSYYKARAHAFRLIAVSAEGQESPLFAGVNISELIMSLSPDSIMFDKVPTPASEGIASYFGPIPK